MLCVCELVTCELLAVKMKRRKEDNVRIKALTTHLWIFF